MLCLGIETSCDDTSLALIADGRLVGEMSSSQVDVHALFGGVVPEIASREHARFIGPLCDALLARYGVAPADIDVVAAARGPGLLGSLLVGVAFAKAFALGCGARLIGVNHLHAHLLAVGLVRPLLFPALGLLVSGGHTHLYRIASPTEFLSLGRTLDDAAGEAFDKAGKLLGLPYPAGRFIDALASEGEANPALFPRPYLDNDTLNFSFSGLKTAMLQYVRAHPELVAGWNAGDGQPLLPEGEKRARLAGVCASYRLAVVETLVAKAQRALAMPEQADVRAVMLAGGVAANSLLRTRMEALAVGRGKAFLTPPPELCTDNGAMVGYLGWLLASAGYRHSLSMEAIPRGRPVPDDMMHA